MSFWILQKFIVITKSHEAKGAGDNYMNLALVLVDVHRLIHAKGESTIKKYMEALHLNKQQLSKLNRFRKEIGLEEIKAS